MSDYHYEYDNLLGNCMVSIMQGKTKIMEKLLWECLNDWDESECDKSYDLHLIEEVNEFKERFKDKKCSKKTLEKFNIIHKENNEEEDKCNENNEENYYEDVELFPLDDDINHPLKYYPYNGLEGCAPP